MKFRIFAASFHWFIVVLRSLEIERLPMFCYLTNMVYILCASYYTIAAYNSLSLSEESLPLYHKLIQNPLVFRMDRVCYEEKLSVIKIKCLIQWLLHSIVLNLSILVSVMYFLLIYKPDVDRLGLTNISRHILNSVFILTEFSLNSIHVKFVHVIYGLSLAVIYAFYTLIFWYVIAPPENYIYELINWNQPKKTLKLIFMLMSAAVIVKCILVGFSKAKFRSHGCQVSRDIESPAQSFLV